VVGATAAGLPAAVDTKADHKGVGAMAEGLPAVADIKAGRRAVAIVAVIPEVVRVVVPRAGEALSLQAAMLRQDIMAVDSSCPGGKPASSHRSPSGGSERSLLVSLRM
jgi:hypothetical protein